MKLFSNKDLPNVESAQHLTEAIQLLAKPKPAREDELNGHSGDHLDMRVYGCQEELQDGPNVKPALHLKEAVQILSTPKPTPEPEPEPEPDTDDGCCEENMGSGIFSRLLNQSPATASGPIGRNASHE